MSTSFNYAMEDVINNYGIPIVQSTRAMSGEVPTSDVSSDSALHSMASWASNVKLRILLANLINSRKWVLEPDEVSYLAWHPPCTWKEHDSDRRRVCRVDKRLTSVIGTQLTLF